MTATGSRRGAPVPSAAGSPLTPAIIVAGPGTASADELGRSPEKAAWCSASDGAHPLSGGWRKLRYRAPGTALRAAGRSPVQVKMGRRVNGPFKCQSEYLGVLPQGIPPVGTNEPEHPTEELVEEGQGQGSAWLSASELVKSHMGVNRTLHPGNPQSSLGELVRSLVRHTEDPAYVTQRHPSAVQRPSCSPHLRRCVRLRCRSRSPQAFSGLQVFDDIVRELDVVADLLRACPGHNFDQVGSHSVQLAQVPSMSSVVLMNKSSAH